MALDEADLFIRDDDDQQAKASPFADLSIHAADDLAGDPAAAEAAPPTPAPRMPDVRITPEPAPAPAVRPASVSPRPQPAASISTAAAATATATPPSPFAGLAGTAPTSRPTPPVVEPPVQRTSMQPPSAPIQPQSPQLAQPPSQPQPRPAPTTELPLFVRGTAAADAARVDEPLVRLPAETRPPLSVRRPVGDTPAAKPRTPASGRSAGPLDRDLLADLQSADDSRPGHAAGMGHASDADADAFKAGAGKRLFAAIIDGVLLASLSATVMWITLRWCGLPLDGALMLSVLVPTGAFLSLVGVGYLVLFTAAGGQTPGKMAAGIRVVDDGVDENGQGTLGFGQAVLRAVLTLPSVLAAGIGFLPALVGDQRALHDRLAQTRVVRE